MSVKLFCVIQCDHCKREAQTTIAVSNWHSDGEQRIGRVDLPNGWTDLARGKSHFCDDDICIAVARRGSIYHGAGALRRSDG